MSKNPLAQHYCRWCLKPFDPISSLWDILKGPQILCPSCNDQLQPKPIKFTLEGVSCYAFYPYQEPFSRLLIQYKEALDLPLVPLFFLKQKAWLRRLSLFNRLVLCPHGRMRPFDPLLEMCQGLKVGRDLIKKDHHLQKKGSLVERSLVRFDIEKIDLPLKPVIIIDDLVTTGSSLKEAIKTYRYHGVKVHACVTSLYHPLWVKHQK